MPSSPSVFSTPLTRLFNINHPVMLAGMNVAAGPKLAAAVTNAGGIGVIGGIRQSPKMLQDSIDELKSHLENKDAPFGVDLLIPQVGGNARKTNYDYTKGQLPELTEVIIRSKAALFVCAVGVPPRDMVDKLHAAGIVVMNMFAKALAQGVDIICAQGGEGGGHTGDTPFSVLIPAVVDLCKNAKSPLTGEPVIVVAAGGIADGRGLAAAFSEKRQQEIKEADFSGQDPARRRAGEASEKSMEGRMWLMGKVAGSINKDVKPAKAIVDELVTTAAASLQKASSLQVSKAKL
ncbi:putative nitronate monooxygenase [Grifola frondosa]|uniref:Putative nitronate monooxygenase n=1 Tax=Grifola frondosa TaxID=5627 RepID=A0A1C7MFX0_GRIFR|nr:putative nitronate monooxygenase [Grifola frondosa]